MSQWRNSLYFTFDGVSSQKYKLMLMDVNEDGHKSKFGLDRTVQEEESALSDVPYFIRVKNNGVDIIMELVHASNDLVPQPFTEEEESKIKRWIFRSEYKALTIGGLTYFVIFEKSATIWKNANEYGYLTLTAHVQDGFAHQIFTTEGKPRSSEVLNKIHNTSEVDKPVYMNMEITQLSNKNEDIIITNKSNGDSITIKSVQQGENIVVYSKDQEVYSLTNPDTNMFKNVTYNNHFISLRYGENKISCKGNFNVTFIYDLLMQF